MLKYVLIALVVLAMIAVIVGALSSAKEKASEEDEANQQAGLAAR